MARTMTKRQLSYYAQRKREGDEWCALKAAAKATCDALTDLDELADAARAYLIADADLYRFQYGYRDPEIVARLLRRANSPAYCRVWALHQLCDRLKKAADAMHDMTPEERATYEARSQAEAETLNRAINAMLGQMLNR